MATAHKLRLEVRQETFTNWCNKRLKGSGTKIEDLRRELYDGPMLITLLEQLSGKEVEGAQGVKNLDTAFDFMKNQEKIPVFIGQRDIDERNLEQILGLVWTLISKYQIMGGEDTNNVAEKPSAKSLLLNWLQASMPEDLSVSNFTSDWTDGQLISALVDMKKPGAIPNFRSLCPEDALVNTKRAMDIAEAECSIPKVIEAEHMCSDNPDELSMMTYLSYFCCGVSSPGCKNLLAWVQVKIPECNIQNFTEDWRDGQALTALVNTVAEGTLPNHASLDPSNGVENVGVAMKIANEELERKQKANKKVDGMKKPIEELGGILGSITPELFTDECTCPLAVMCYIEGLRKVKLLSSSGQDNNWHSTRRMIAESFNKATSFGEGAKQKGSRFVKGAFWFLNKAARSRSIVKVLIELQQADLITTGECLGLSDISHVVDLQSKKTPQVMVSTADILKRNGLEDESSLLIVQAVFAELHLTTEERERVKDVSDVVVAQKGKSPEVMVTTAKLLLKYGFEDESEQMSVQAVLPDLQQANLVTIEESERLKDFTDVVVLQISKTPEIMFETVEILGRRGFRKEFEAISVSVLLAKLQQAGLTSKKEKDMQSGVSGVVRVQRGKSPALMAITANVLSKFGFEKESQFLFVLAELGQADMITSDERGRLSDPSDVVSIQCGKSPQVLTLTAAVLSRFQGFKEESTFLAVLAELQQANLITSEECKGMHDLDDMLRVLSGKPDAKDILKNHDLQDVSKLNSVIAELREVGLDPSAGCRILLDSTCRVEVLSCKPPGVVTRSEYILAKNGLKFAKEFKVLAVIFELKQYDLITDIECEGMRDLNDVVRVQSKKPQGILNETAEIMKKHKFETEAKFIADAILLTARPTMEQVSELVVPKVPSQWKSLGRQLGFTLERLQAIEGFMREDNCCTTMFKVWLQNAAGTGSKQRSWKSILSAVERENGSVVNEIREALKKPSVAGAPQDLDMDLLAFEERYAEVVQNQASVTLKITKCTTIGPPRKGKTCLKHLLTGQKWDVTRGTASTDVMEAPEWVECGGEEEEAKELWKLVSEEEQQRKVIKAVITVPTATPALSIVLPTAAVSFVPRAATLASALYLPTSSGVLPTGSPSNASPTTTSSDAPATAKPSDARTNSKPKDDSSTTVLSSSPCPATPMATASDLKAGTLMQGVQALASVCSSEALEDLLKDKQGTVLGETQLIHFIDTGGQAIYHDTHPVLITSPSVYLVVFSLEDFYQKNNMERIEYFQSAIIQHPLESICAFGTKTPQAKDHLKFHPEAPKIFIVGTHLDKIPLGDSKEFLNAVNEMIAQEIGNRPYRQFVQYDPHHRSFWAVDNTQAGMEQDEGAMKYISTLRKKVQHKSMEMSVKVPLPWMLLKVVMESKGVPYCKYSELLKEAQIRGYVSEESPREDLDTESELRTMALERGFVRKHSPREDLDTESELPTMALERGFVRKHSPDEDLDTMLRLFHILSLFYHKVPTGCRKEDSLVFIAPDCLYSATSDFLMAAKEDISENLCRTQGATMEARHGGEELTEDGMNQQKLEPGVVEKNRVIERMEDNSKYIQCEVETVLLKVEDTLAKLDQEHTKEVLELLRSQLVEMGERYKLRPKESQDASTMSAKRKLFIGRLVHSLVSTVEAVQNDSEMMGDVHNVMEEAARAVKRIRDCYQRRAIDRQVMDQVLLILSDLRIVAQMSNLDNYVVPAALPKGMQSMEICGEAAPILVTLLSQTIMQVCYLPSSLFCCLITELVTGSGWTVIPLVRTHVAFAHEGLTGKVHLIEHESYIEVKLESEVPLKELAQTHQLQTVRKSIHESIVRVYSTVYRGSTAYAMPEESLVWGFRCEEHPNDDTHIAAFQEQYGGFWAECLISSDQQDVEQEQFEWF